MAKGKLYRVIAMHELAEHTGSDFDRFSDVESAKNWAISFGQKKGAEYVILSVKSENRYNHYNEVTRISINQ